MKKIYFLLVLIGSQLLAQQGGMWIPSMLEGMNEREMRSLGMRLTAKDIYNINQSSLKDAVPHFNGGCTAEVISDQGLILTNHHCGYDEIQSHSTLEHNYLKDGFWALTMDRELPNPDLEVTFVIRIEDVTQQILARTAKLSETEKQEAIKANIADLQEKFPKESYQEIKIKPIYEGNQYLLFVTETFKDVRLVGAPPSSIGKFGSDTDNWVWPRHTGDFSLFRIYADENNHPAAYSASNVPYKPKHYFPISIKGVEEEDFTMVMGYPGRTQEYLPAIAVEQIANVYNPAKIEIRDRALKVMDSFMRKNEAIKIQYASKYASIANYWKKWAGESKGLNKSTAYAFKKAEEKKFLKKLSRIKKRKDYATLLLDFEDYYTEIEPYTLSREIFNEVALRNTELLQIGYKLYQLENVYKNKGEQAFKDRLDNFIKSQSNFYKDYNVQVDEPIFQQLMDFYISRTPESFLPSELRKVNVADLTQQVYQQSGLTSYPKLQALLQGSAQEIIQRLHNDKGYQVIKQMADAYFEKVNPKYEQINAKIATTQQKYITALLEINKREKGRMFPDANSTLRVTYGQVKGYEPMDGVYYEPFTTLDGVFEKYKPNDYEFDVPLKLIELYQYKDYGMYANKDGKMPVCFIATNHTTGGNSGSPALDKKGNLIGLNFDRVWEGTMSDIYYHPDICRNIMVDIRYVLFIIDKYAEATNIMEELDIIR